MTFSPPEYCRLFAKKKAYRGGRGGHGHPRTPLATPLYLQLIKDCYPHILQKYAKVDDKQLLWELIKMEIRSETIRYSKGKIKELKQQENVIQGRIEELDFKICNEVCLDQNILSEYKKLKKELQEI